MRYLFYNIVDSCKCFESILLTNLCLLHHMFSSANFVFPFPFSPPPKIFFFLPIVILLVPKKKEHNIYVERKLYINKETGKQQTLLFQKTPNSCISFDPHLFPWSFLYQPINLQTYSIPNLPFSLYKTHSHGLGFRVYFYIFNSMEL